jgi:SAM-dependent methyltransferase
VDAAQLELHAAHEDRHWWFVGRRRILRRIVEALLPPGRDGRILDVGCGTGGNLGAFADAYGTAGIDLSEAAVALARARFPRIEFWGGPLEQAPEALFAQADLVLLTDVLEHTPDDHLFLSTLLTRLRTGARVIVTVPAHRHLWSSHDVALEHYRRYDREQLARVWTGLAVGVPLLSYYNSRLYWPIRLVRAVARRLGRGFGRQGTDLRLPPVLLNSLLTRVFGGEAARLAGVLANGLRPFRRGVSLFAVLEKTGAIAPRHRPPDAPPDLHDPRGLPGP